MPRSVIHELLDDASEDEVIDGADDLESKVQQQIVNRVKKAGAASMDEPGDETVVDDIVDEPMEEGEKSAFDRQVQAAIDELNECADVAESEKVASEGGNDFGESALMFRKVAHLLSEQARLLEGRQALARFHETVKVASDLIADGSIEVPAEKSLYDFLTGFSKHDLGAVKTAHQLFTSKRLQEIGDAVPKDSPADEPMRADGSDAAWFRMHPSLTQ